MAPARPPSMHRLLAKLQIAPHSHLLVIDAPAEIRDPLLRELPASRVHTTRRGARRHGVLLIFVRSQADVRRASPLLRTRSLDEALVWFAYPKKTSQKYSTDLSRDRGWDPLGRLGYEAVRLVAVDDDWSALRFRHVSRIRTLTRSPARILSVEGKRRARAARKDLRGRRTGPGIT